MTGESVSNPKNETTDSNSPYYIHAYDSPRQMQTNVKNDETQGEVTRKANMEGKSNVKNDDWITDLGSNDHIIHKRDILENLSMSHSETSVVIPNGESIYVEATGDTTLKSATKIGGVLYIPRFNCNLLSKESYNHDFFEIPTWYEDIVESGFGEDGLWVNEETYSSSDLTKQTVKDESGDHSSSEPHNSVLEEEPSTSPVDNEDQTTRQKRNKSQPTRFRDFDVELPHSIDHTQTTPDQPSSVVYPIANYVSYDAFSDTHKAYLEAITKNSERKDFFQAMQDAKW
uniref:Retrovirus-related Pol polyprotein from transposon TNT 1-94-like beta-barrel domain-containing protein n=1 Tax=Lactuca sativa TaxID=4236 RepID=A0A9R1WAC8_LACSA|nr:hypothetical protein LSAT_V11C300106340 [Lactuca sativa]